MEGADKEKEGKEDKEGGKGRWDREEEEEVLSRYCGLVGD